GRLALHEDAVPEVLPGGEHADARKFDQPAEELLRVPAELDLPVAPVVAHGLDARHRGERPRVEIGPDAGDVRGGQAGPDRKVTGIPAHGRTEDGPRDRLRTRVKGGVRSWEHVEPGCAGPVGLLRGASSRISG